MKPTQRATRILVALSVIGLLGVVLLRFPTTPQGQANLVFAAACGFAALVFGLQRASGLTLRSAVPATTLAFIASVVSLTLVIFGNGVR